MNTYTVTERYFDFLERFPILFSAFGLSRPKSVKIIYDGRQDGMIKIEQNGNGKQNKAFVVKLKKN
jgi:hypothetical protein